MTDSAPGAASSSASELQIAGAPTADRTLVPGWFLAGRRANTSADEWDETAAGARSGAWIPIAMLAIVIAAFLFRYAAAQHLSSHVDESASVLAIEMVADKGLPVFPSGTLYLQGATLSYLLAPVLWLGRGGLDDLFPLRLLSVFAGTLAIVFAYFLGKTVTRNATAGVAFALLMTIDPVSIRWGGMVRMYALLQCLALLVIWLLSEALIDPPRRRRMIVLVAAFWVGVFTHIAICLLLPGMILAAALVYGRSLLDKRRDLGLALVACAVSPVVLLGLNKLVSPADKSVSSTIPGVSFVGDFLLSFDQILHPSLQSWVLLFDAVGMGIIMPAIIAGAAFLLLGRYFLGEPGRDPGTVERQRVLLLLSLLYWLPIAAVSLLATEQNERYLIHIHPFGLLLLVLLLDDLLRNPAPRLEARLHRVAASVPFAPPARPGRFIVDPTLSGSVVEGASAPGSRGLALPSWLTSRWAAVAAVAGVTVIAAFVRINHLTHLSLWLDEGFSVLYSRQTWASVTGTNGFYSPHPPLYFTLVKVVDLVAPDQIAGRLISVVAGIATIPVFYLLISRVLDRRAALVSALLLALSPIHLYYSQEARMYALVVFLVATTYLALVSYYRRPSIAWAAVYGVSAALALWVDYSSVYALAPQAIFILVQFYRHRSESIPLLAAAVLAVVAYLPWAPQVLASIDAANQVERREDYLGVDQSRLGTALLSMIGYAGDGSYFQSLRPTAWNRWPDSRAILILVALPLVVLGARMLWRRWLALAVTAGLIGTMLVGIWVSLISPGFAERTVLTTTLGWAALAGAAFSGKMSGLARSVAALALVCVLAIQITTIDVINNGAIKQLWKPASADVASVNPLGYPLITYSYGAVADTLVDVYQPGLLGGMRVITIRDGELENVLSGGVIPEVGLSRTFDVASGALGTELPQTPENDLIWYLYYTREGEEEVRAAISRLGYTRVMHNHYAAPRYQVFLDLWARPGAVIGTPVPLDASFTAGPEGWLVPEHGATVSTDAVPVLTLSNTSVTIAESALVVPGTGPSLNALTVEFMTTGAAANVGVVLSCQSAAGMELASQRAEIPEVGGAAGTWRTTEVAALCPEGTVTLRVSLQNTGIGEVSFRSPALSSLPIQPDP